MEHQRVVKTNDVRIKALCKRRKRKEAIKREVCTVCTKCKLQKKARNTFRIWQLHSSPAFDATNKTTTLALYQKSSSFVSSYYTWTPHFVWKNVMASCMHGIPTPYLFFVFCLFSCLFITLEVNQKCNGLLPSRNASMMRQLPF